MARYEYQCKNCDDQTLTVERPMTEDEPNEGYQCPACGYRMARVFYAAPASFKGSGFYSTGSR